MFISRRNLIFFTIIFVTLLLAVFWLGTKQNDAITQIALVPTPTISTTQPTTSPTFTASVTPTNTSTRILTGTPYPTNTPYPTPTPFSISSPNPTDLELIRLIVNWHYPDFYLTDSEIAIMKNTYDAFSRTNQDVNGDGKPEVIIIGQIADYGSYLAILQYDENSDRWQEMHYLANFATWAGHEIGIKINKNRVVISTEAGWHGTGMQGATWSQTWLQCSETKCDKTWISPILDFEWQEQGTYSSIYYNLTTELQVNKDSITLTKQSFGIATEYIWEPNNDRYPGTTHKTVGPRLVETYKWDGNKYALAERKEISLQQDIIRESDQATVNTIDFINQTISKHYWKQDPVVSTFFYMDEQGRDKAIASFWGIEGTLHNNGLWGSKVFNPKDGSTLPGPVAAARTTKGNDLIAAVLGAKRNDKCRLVIHKLNGEQFERIAYHDIECTPSFTRVVWLDIDRDNKEELLFITIPKEQVERQKLYIYRVGKELEAIAHLSGTLNGPDGAGVRWEQQNGATIFFAGIAPAAECDAFSCLDTTRRWKTYRWDKTRNALVEEK
ncbi:MAG: hypothetical protein EYC68_10940 [Chloroflexota bacterium]|nr:MAG: hypothetical protein EYC68_10940 [Chloroflexota bacterium]